MTEPDNSTRGGAPGTRGDSSAPAGVGLESILPKRALPTLGRPSNLLSGTGQGLALAAGGAAAGVVTLIAAPVAGGVQGGAAGAAAGLGLGALGLAGLTVVGVGAGGRQLVVGAINTPATVGALITSDDLHGKEKIDLSEVSAELSEEERRYRRDRSTVSESLFFGGAGAGGEEEYVPRKDVADMTYYERLQVPADASASAIKKQYYKLARKAHPDKGGDPEAFQQLGEAYQVLSVPDKRRLYDQGQPTDRSQLVDPGIMFGMMFGDELFEHLVGDLTIVMAMRLPEGLAPEERTAKLDELQAMRERRLAKLLATRLETWCTGESAEQEKFLKEALVEYAKLRTANLGEPMLNSIGKMYEFAGDRQRGFRGNLGIAAAAQNAQRLKRYAKALGAAQDMQAKQKEFLSQSQSQQATQAPSFQREVEGSLFEVLALDIESTCSAVALLVLGDVSVSKEVRRRRARGLQKLGKIFQGEIPKCARSASQELRADGQGSSA